MRPLNTVPTRIYSGSPQPRALNYMGREGAGVPMTISWVGYGASTSTPQLGVIVNMQTKDVQSQLKQVRSIYIDNLGVDVPVYVYFPDTQYSVVAQPNSSGWFKCFTNDLVFIVIGLGFETGTAPVTYVLATNLDIETAIDIELAQNVALWKASPIITQGGTIFNSAFGAPALGDDMIDYLLTISGVGVLQNNLWGTPHVGEFLTLTHVDIKLTNIRFTLANTDSFLGLLLESTGGAGVLYNLSWGPTVVAGAGITTAYGNQQLRLLSGMNTLIDASQTWRLRVTNFVNLTAPLLSAHFNFTLAPQ